ncbi:MAG: RHS repeat protein, partial [bacterium]|nr:RHS repeat protein [Candidatus Kapabacteria bacterium]
MSFAYNGVGARTAERDQIGSGIVKTIDARGRVTGLVHQDGSTSTTEYLDGTPVQCGINDQLQQFHGYCSAVITTDPAGGKRARYLDAFDQLRREIVAPGTLDLTTRYEYDGIGKLTLAINPNGDSTQYSYDAFGRILTKRQPDLGVVSYAYDNLGNVRFTQSSDQHANGLLTYTQYDDLSRPTAIGEASVADTANAQTRLTSRLDGNRMHTDVPGDVSSTMNHSLWQAAGAVPQPRVWAYATLRLLPMGCQLRPTTILGETNDPPQPYLSHPIGYYDPITAPVASTRDFENIARYPHFVRTVMCYDRMPARQGAIWSGMPTSAEWDSIAPRGSLRNLLGREAAVAWREHGGEPWHYAVFSYDARGRIEAMLRYTDNVGFDAVYYEYNALNLVTSVRVADPLNLHSTWYGYDQNGKLDSIWTQLDKGRGLGFGTALRPQVPVRPHHADVVHTYTRTGHVATMSYPTASVEITYAYNARKWLDSIIARSSSNNAGPNPVFKQRLTYDSDGQTSSQAVSFSGGAETVHRYAHDQAKRMTQWNDGMNTDAFVLDRVGNRKQSNSDRVWVRTTHTYAPASIGPNRLLTSHAWDARGDWY